jgi:methylenetetrahydrofolate reductase (NADPH)
MNEGKVPGAVVAEPLLRQIQTEWRDRATGSQAAIERAARLAAVLKGLGYRGIHIGGVHRGFDTVGRILDRLAQIEHQWQTYLPDFDFPQADGFYAFSSRPALESAEPAFGRQGSGLGLKERLHFALLDYMHAAFFDQQHRLAPVYRKFSKFLDGKIGGRLLAAIIEHPSKRLLLDCQKCGDCGIQHVAYLCPESQCPKHIRNGACGGSRDGHCEVRPDRPCVWFRTHQRWSSCGQSDQMIQGCVPPRMWELNQTSAWLNFHLRRDHQSASTEIIQRCRISNFRKRPV